ncbi:FHA domain-containing protein [Scytonema sp. UIC 10036]|uniref:FAD-binding oxidoreductase n=1 Tax=Scytonema sp. UIC 10036 TaxID=2304196 RepID=UPI0012DAA311|nr:FAD-binding oxidoreductase [Scytonema sp. UIC 10036]MUG91086.1 FHA domain-containing protein [Scytonema sp. UIC 10036]
MLKLKLFNSKAPTEGKELEINPEMLINGECFIGRSRNCGIVLPSSEVSRIHGSLRREQEQYYFSDLASLGGSRINDEVANVNQKYLLKNNDIIRIGEFILTVEATSSNGHHLTQTEEVQTQPSTQKKSANITISVPHQQVESTRHPSEYMPVALVPPDQMSRWMKGDVMVRCVAVIDETHDVKTFRFAAEASLLFTYQPGQFITLNLEINGKPVKRSYSISSTPSRPHTLEITVKRVPSPPDAPDISPGLVSNWLHDNLRVGHEIKISGPLGKFTCFANPSEKMLMISAGSGITPMMSMSRWVLDTAADCDIIFFHCARSPRDIIFRQELELMSSHNPKFRLAFSITRPEPGQPWWGFTGRLNEQLLYAIDPDFWQRTVYVCGPNSFMQGVKTMLEQIGFPMQNYYEESFGGAKKAKLPPSSTPVSPAANPPIAPTVAPPPSVEPVAEVTPTVAQPVVSTVVAAKLQTAGSVILVFSKSGKEITYGGEEPILDIAEEEGVNLDSSCRSGVCGTCKIRKLQGEVKYTGEPEALDESEQEEGYILTCIAYPTGKVLIDA